MANASKYDAEFRAEAVKRFRHTVEQMPLASMSAIGNAIASELGIARSTLMSWVSAAGDMPVPTWGEIHRLRAHNQMLEREVARLKEIVGEE
ncbi:hypothetical protein [Corynebacterium auriscanis]|uniref:hypothetical protein n=1 Tax=Corynebacterium auriscanis TaxID=99807 RepID=UPI003CED2EEB